MRSLFCVVLLLTFLFLSVLSSAQQTPVTAVPNLIRYGGMLKDGQGRALPETTVGVAFAIYQQQEGGAPVWLETQNVTPNATGYYSVLLGSSSSTGLPDDLFTQREGRWLGVQMQGQPEQPRVLLVSVPYALKAAEADRLSGHSASEFVTTDNLQSAVQQQLRQQAPKSGSATSVITTSTGANAGVIPATTDPATNFVDTTRDQVVQVQQNGTGVALNASASNNSGMVGTSNASAITGIVAGVEGVSSANASYGVYGRATSSSSSQPGVGIYGQSDSPNGLGISGWAAGTGNTIGLQGGASSTSGFAINATETASSGNTAGLVARVYSPVGIPVLIFNNATSTVTGTLISARTLSGVQFSVGGTGNVNTVGTLTGTRLISTVASGTAPLQVASTTLVPNLNASLLGGSPASAFSPASGSPSYIQNGTTQQAGANFSISGSGTVGATLSGNAVDTATNYQIGAGVVMSLGSAADENLFLGIGAGTNNTSGSGAANMFSGYNAGIQNTTGNNNTFSGALAGHMNTIGVNNTFVGANSGQSVVTGSNNTFLGFNAGSSAAAAASNDVYIASQGTAAESSTIRIGDPTNQTAAYVAGVSGASTNSGAPVFIDSTGKLGTGGGSVSFTQVTGTLTSPQFTGTYSNSVTLSNANNVIDGNFTGNGSGLTGVSSGLSWPIVLKSADYTIQASDFSTPTSYGNYLILTGSVAHTFTLPNPAPPNGQCVAIDNNAGAPINSNTNVFLTVSANGLTIDGGAGNATQPKRNSYLYCSDGTNYWRLDRQLASPSQIGPVLYTVDTGPVNALQTTFVAGLDFGLNTGTAIFILPIHANTILNPTLNVNGLGAKKILRYGNQGLAPGDLSTTALAVLIYDGQFWELVNPQTVIGTVTSVGATAPLVSTGGSAPVVSCPTCVTAPTLTGTTGSIGGSTLTAGSCATGTAAVAGSVVGHPVSVSASDGSLPNGLIILSAAVTSSNTVTVQLCATGSVTPTANTYTVSTQ
ncbi:MAG: hypothetical protein WAN69_02910 [Candidatus Korobacteraceae bacterium]